MYFEDNSNVKEEEPFKEVENILVRSMSMRTPPISNTPSPSKSETKILSLKKLLNCSNIGS